MAVEGSGGGPTTTLETATSEAPSGTDSWGDQALATLITDTAAGPSAYTNQDFAVSVLLQGDFPITENNVQNLMAWMLAENKASTWTGTAGANNPFNNGLNSGGGDGTGSYLDLQDAALNVALGLQGQITGGQYIGAALKANAPFAAFHAATIKATWSADHYAGTDWLDETSPPSVPLVTAAESAANGATSGVKIGSGEVAKAGNVDTEDAGAVTPGLGITAPGWLTSLGSILGDVDSAAWWKRVGVFALGGALIIGGIILFVSTTKTGQTVESDAAVAAVA